MVRKFGLGLAILLVVSSGCLGIQSMTSGQTDNTTSEKPEVVPNRLQIQALQENLTVDVEVINEKNSETVIDSTYEVSKFNHLNLNDGLHEGTPYVVTISVIGCNETTFRINETETKVAKIESNGEIHVVTVEER